MLHLVSLIASQTVCAEHEEDILTWPLVHMVNLIAGYWYLGYRLVWYGPEAAVGTVGSR